MPRRCGGRFTPAALSATEAGWQRWVGRLGDDGPAQETLAEMEKAGKIKGPLHVQFVMGVKNAMPVDRRAFEFYVETLKRLSPGATFTGAGIGKDALTVALWSMELGGHVRTGMEDNVRLDKHTLAPSNAALVRQVGSRMAEHGRRPATVAEARTLLALRAA